MIGIGTGIGFKHSTTFDWVAYWSTRYPSALALTVVSDTAIDLDWTNNGTADYDGVSIERSIDGVNYSEIDTVAAGDTSYSDTGLTEGTRYYYKLRYYSGTNCSGYCTPVDDYTIPTAPTALIITVVSYSRLDLSWTNNSSNMNGTSIERSTDGINYTEITTVSGATSSYSNTGLSGNIEYFYKLRSYVGATTYSSYSNTKSATTPEAWYLAGGVPSANCIAAYQPKGATSLANSYVNVANPGTYNAAPGTAPTWDEVSGWKFDGASQYLVTGVVPENDQTWSLIVAFTDYSGGQDSLAGLYHTETNSFYLQFNSSLGIKRANNGPNTFASDTSQLGVFAVCGNKMYFDGVKQGNDIAASSGVITRDIYIGALNYDTVVQFFDGNIQAVAIYDKELTSDELIAVTNAINNLDKYYSQRVSYVNQGFGSLICWNMITFTQDTWQSGEKADPNLNMNSFAPTDLDIDDWLDSCVVAGMKYAILTVKHHDGFKLWPTASKVGVNNPYCISGSSWYINNGSPDIVDLFVTKCREKGLNVGLYYSIWDKTWETQAGKDETTDAAGYIAMIEDELTELLTNYGTIDSIWFDGWSWHLGFEEISYQTIFNIVKGLQDNCVVVDNNPSTHPNLDTQIETYETTVGGAIPVGNTRLAEEVQSIRDDGHWFYHLNDDQTSDGFFTKAQLLTKLGQVNARTGTYLLGLTPDKSGHLPPVQKTLLESLTT